MGLGTLTCYEHSDMLISERVAGLGHMIFNYSLKNVSMC